jgi:Ca2+-transporting ATPase
MITGDSPATAQTIAEELNIMRANSLVVEGRNIESLTPHEFARVNVFARVNPSHKQVIVERYQDQNKVVAMTGDGVNDALALAMSDAGIAMGITGTDVAKEAADIVITDDSFTSIVTGIHEGRGLFTKIRMMVFFYIAINVFEATLLFGGLFLIPEVPLFFGLQNLYIIVTTHTFPAFGLIFDKTSPRAMEEKPRDSEELVTRQLAKFLVLNIILMIVGAAIVYFLTFTHFIGVDPYNLQGYFSDQFVVSISAAKATVMMLTVILLVESILVLVIRRINMPLTKGIREPGIGRYIVFLGFIYLAHLLLMYVPAVQEMLTSVNLNFYFMPLTILDWVICIICALPAIVGMELYKYKLRSDEVTL